MPATKKRFVWITAVAALFLLAAGGTALAQGREMYQATAMGTGTQFGQMFEINIIIESWSTVQDQQVLIDAFNQRGNEGMVNALDKMPSRGRLAITGTVGFDIHYARVFPTATGKKIRIVTDRPIQFGELWYDGRSLQYSLSVVELDISNVKGQSGGALLPACKFYVSKEGELTMEAFQNPWKLVNVMAR